MTECSVCLDDVQPSNPDCVVLPCDHIFHSQCIDEWRNQPLVENQEVTCPNCRQGVQQESMQEIMRPFEYLDLVLIPAMIIIWLVQGLLISVPLKVASKTQAWALIVYNYHYTEAFTVATLWLYNIMMPVFDTFSHFIQSSAFRLHISMQALATWTRTILYFVGLHISHAYVACYNCTTALLLAANEKALHLFRAIHHIFTQAKRIIMTFAYFMNHKAAQLYLIVQRSVSRVHHVTRFIWNGLIVTPARITMEALQRLIVITHHSISQGLWIFKETVRTILESVIIAAAHIAFERFLRLCDHIHQGARHVLQVVLGVVQFIWERMITAPARVAFDRLIQFCDHIYRYATQVLRALLSVARLIWGRIIVAPARFVIDKFLQLCDHVHYCMVQVRRVILEAIQLIREGIMMVVDRIMIEINQLINFIYQFIFTVLYAFMEAVRFILERIIISSAKIMVEKILLFFHHIHYALVRCSQVILQVSQLLRRATHVFILQVRIVFVDMIWMPIMNVWLCMLMVASSIMDLVRIFLERIRFCCTYVLMFLYTRASLWAYALYAFLAEVGSSVVLRVTAIGLWCALLLAAYARSFAGPLFRLSAYISTKILAVYQAFIAWLPTESPFMRNLKAAISRQLDSIVNVLRFVLVDLIYNIRIFFILGYYIEWALVSSMQLIKNCVVGLFSIIEYISLGVFNVVLYPLVVWLLFPAYALVARAVCLAATCFYWVSCIAINAIVALCARVTHAAQTTASYFFWVGAVSTNALVALAQMGWIWIRMRALKVYHFFMPPVLHALTTIRAMISRGWAKMRELWSSAKSAIISATRFIRYTIAHTVYALRIAYATTMAIVYAAALRFKHGCTAARQAVKDSWNAIKQRCVARWKIVLESMKMMWMGVKSQVVDRWQVVKMGVWMVKERVARTWSIMTQLIRALKEMVKVRIVERMQQIKTSVGIVKERVRNTWKHVAQLAKLRRAAMKGRVVERWQNVRQTFGQIKASSMHSWKTYKQLYALYISIFKAKWALYNISLKSRFNKSKQRAKETWRQSRDRFKI